jgi:hypothetical protein
MLPAKLKAGMYAGGKQICRIIERSGAQGKIILLSHY